MSGTAYPPVTIAQLRADHPAFADPIAFPDGPIATYLAAANAKLDPLAWGEMWVIGIELWVGHFLSLDRLATRDALRGGAPGMNLGAIASKSVGPASVSFDAGSAAEKDAGMWNMTTYGRRWIHLARLVGSAPIQVNPSYGGAGFPGSSFWVGAVF